MGFRRVVKVTGMTVSAGLMCASTALASPAGVSLDPGTSGVDTARGCVVNGYAYFAKTAAGPHCFATTDNSTVAPLAQVDSSKTAAQLTAVEDSSPLDPSKYLAKNTFATHTIGNAPLASNSSDIAAFVANQLPRLFLPSQFADWLRTGANVGDGVDANDNIPIYEVDSSNPNQTYAQFSSTDPRVTNYLKLQAITSGKIPLPTWAKMSDGGDHSFAIYDVGTGIWRSYYQVAKQDDGSYTYSASGYWYGNPGTNTTGAAGLSNYWLSLVQGSSSVIGISNELTQIGAQEVKNGVINHAVSVTLPTYQNVPSFPAKQSDGNFSATQYPNMPQPGQRFTFPASFDVNAYVKANNIDPTTAAIMRAVQKYGGIVSDRNSWCMAFNFENPYGMGATASQGVNAYQSDAVLSSKMNAMNINAFPWAQTAWVSANYADGTS